MSEDDATKPVSPSRAQPSLNNPPQRHYPCVGKRLALELREAVGAASRIRALGLIRDPTILRRIK